MGKIACSLILLASAGCATHHCDYKQLLMNMPCVKEVQNRQGNMFIVTDQMCTELDYTVTPPCPYDECKEQKPWLKTGRAPNGVLNTGVMSNFGVDVKACRVYREIVRS